MIDQLLMLARLNHADDKRVKVNVVDSVQSALGRFSAQIELNAIKIQVELPIPCAYGQAQWIEEIFANLISNAIKYMGVENPKPSITIRGIVCENNTARYEVRDTGIGIRQEDQGRLFEMFTRVHNTVGIEGLGLGLSIVRRIVRKLRGDIGLESVFGEGTTFWFTLPMADAHEDPLVSG
jgi:signal transduction histidine kinase